MTTSSELHRPWRGQPADARRMARREKLVEAGLELFGTQGYRGTSIDAVCAEASLTKRYFYESFANTEELLLATYEEADSRVRGHVDAVVADSGEGDPAALVLVGVEAFFRVLDADKRLARIKFREVFGVSEAMDRAYTAGVEQWEEVIEAGLEGLRIPGVSHDLAIPTCWGLVIGTVLRWVIDDFRRPVDDLIAAVRACVVILAPALDTTMEQFQT